jgi:hypothetical protein
MEAAGDPGFGIRVSCRGGYLAFDTMRDPPGGKQQPGISLSKECENVPLKLGDALPVKSSPKEHFYSLMPGGYRRSIHDPPAMHARRTSP